MDQAPLGNLKARQLQDPEWVLHLPPQLNEVYFFWEDLVENLTNI